jgi:tRNA(Arg) A34 adenosine deaminase TadA
MTRTNETYMLKAIAAAKQAQHEHGVPIGAVLVEQASGEVVATGGSLVDVSKDPTAHAEVNCIRAAAKKLGTDDLYNYTLYSTLEPCHMCLSAAAWAKIPRVFFGAYRKDVDENLFDIKGQFSDEQEAARMNLRENTTMVVTGGVLEADCAKLLARHHEQSRHSN